MQKISILFFGSTTDSVVILHRLSQLQATNYQFVIAAIVTQPPKPIGRNHVVTPTPVETWAKQRALTLLTFESNQEKPWLYTNEQQVIDALQPVHTDLLISASYGVKIPWATINDAKFGGINVHPSILPYWRGADPVPWAILSGDHQIGVTVVTLSQAFDQGVILTQEKIPITPKDTSDPLRTKLFTMGAQLLTDLLPSYIAGKLKPTPQPSASHIGGVKLEYARKFTRQDGFEPWETVMTAVSAGNQAERLERKFRALHPWPGVWTSIPAKQPHEGLRLKILAMHLSNRLLAIDQVQLEGKKPVSWKQFAAAYLPQNV